MNNKENNNTESIFSNTFCRDKDNIINELSKIEMKIMSIDKNDKNGVILLIKNINKLRKDVNKYKNKIGRDDFITNHIEKHLNKYEYILNYHIKI